MKIIKKRKNRIKPIQKNKEVFLIFFIWSIWISAEFLLGPFAHIRIHDSGESLLPALLAAKISFFNYGFSYFLDYLASGVDGASLLLLPFATLNSLFFMIFPGWLAFGILMFLQRFFASYFTYRLCRDTLNLSFWPSLISSFAYSLFNFSIFNLTLNNQFSEPGLPFFLWSFDRILNLDKKVMKVLLAFFLGLLWGYSTYFHLGLPFLLPTVFIWFFIFLKKKKPDSLIVFCLNSLGFLLIQSIQIIPLIINAPLSHRETWNQTFSVGIIKDYINNFLSFLFIYKAQFIFIGIVLFLKANKFLKKQYLFLLLLTLSFWLIPPLYKFFRPYYFPYLKSFGSFQLDRAQMVAPFFINILFAVSIEIFLSVKNKKYLKKFVLILLISFLFFETIKIKINTIKNYAPYLTLYERPDLKDLKSKDGGLFRVATVIGGGIRPGYLVSYGLSTVDGYTPLYPKTYYEFWKKVIEKKLNSDFLKYEDFYNFGSRISLYGPNDFDKTTFINFSEYYNLELLSLANVKYIVSRKPIEDKNLLLLPSAYREQLSEWDNSTKLTKLKLFLKGKYFGPSLYIYENKKVLPRFFILEGSEISNQTIQVIYYSPDKIILTTNNAKPSKIVATINYYPWWKVTIDDQELILSKYQGTFMSVEIPKGNNTLILEYNPPYKI